eukprot:Sdes_comp19377_c0_seq1m10645
MQSGSAIIVTFVQIHATKKEFPDCGEIARASSGDESELDVFKRGSIFFSGIGFAQVIQLNEIVVIVKIEFRHKTFTETESTHAIIIGIQPGRPHTESHHIGNHNHGCSCDGALCGEPNREGKLPRIVVHSARIHDGENISHHSGLDNLLSCDGTNSAVGEDSGNDGHCFAVDGHAADLKVEFESGGYFYVSLEGALFFHEMRQGIISIAFDPFRQIRLIIKTNLGSSRKLADKLHYKIKSIRIIHLWMNQRRKQNSPPIDQRIVRLARIIQYNFRHINPTRLMPNIRVHNIFPQMHHGKRVEDRHAQGLNGEPLCGISSTVALPVYGAQGDSE